MKRTTAGMLVAAGVGAGAVAVRAAASAARAAPDGERWLVVTVNRPPEEVISGDELPGPLAALEDEMEVEVQVRPAPGGRGSELAARPRVPEPTGLGKAAARLTGDDPRQAVRSALRDTKSLLEAGEVVRPDYPPTTRQTPGGRLIGAATRRAGGEGVL